MGVKLRLAREQKGMSLRAAKSLGVSPSFMSQVERGKVMPSVGTLCTIANGLGLAVDDLIRTGKPATKRADLVGSIRATTDLVQRREARKPINLVPGVKWERLTALRDTEWSFCTLFSKPVLPLVRKI
jgi:transcriptional regulator with XRE-family HTH domain